MRALHQVPPEVWHHVLEYSSSLRDHCALRRCVSVLLDKTYCRSCRSDVACMFHERLHHTCRPKETFLSLVPYCCTKFYDDFFHPVLIRQVKISYANTPTEVHIWFDVVPKPYWGRFLQDARQATCRMHRNNVVLGEASSCMYAVYRRRFPPDLCVVVDPTRSPVYLQGFPRWCRRGMLIVFYPENRFASMEDGMYKIVEETYCSSTCELCADKRRTAELPYRSLLA